MRGVLEWFSDPGHAAFAAFVVSVGSLAVAFFALRKSSRTQKRLLGIEEQRERDRVTDAKKAQLIARLEKEPTGAGNWRYFLKITNQGACEARDIEVKLDGRAAMEHPCVLKRQKVIRQLGPASTVRYMLALAPDALLPEIVEMTWVDDSGEPGHYRTTLTP